ncbi:DNA mismatch repair protein MutS [Mucilaginibacter sp. L196]|uniref:MutS-related protein n=1 Tax=Mucilaginibacter sp. L196 TaxID=1641870 RepID=UPI00131C3982|nr:DNA mismatch repair protein MutS [Mucilaginibacter sp. L196]
MEQDTINNYNLRITAANAEVNKYKKLINIYSFLRLGLIGLLVISIYLGNMQNNFTIIAVTLVIVLFGFAWLVSKQSGFEDEKKYFENLVKVNDNEINSVLHHTNMYDNGAAFSNDKHFYSADLDIFGSSSLYQFINRSATTAGNNKLGEWLNAPSEKNTVLLRQDAVKEIASKPDWKTDMQARLLFANSKDAIQLNMLFAYLKLPLEITGEKWLGIYIKIAPLLLSAAIVTSIYFAPITFVAIGLGIFNLLILNSKGELIMKSATIADKIGQVLANYAVVLKIIEAEKWQSPKCTELNQKLNNGQTNKSIEGLAKLINKLGYNLIMIVNFVLNVFFLWSLKQVIAIENWKRDNKQDIETAFDVIAEFEALISLSSVAINYPKWGFPQIADGEAYTIIAKNIAHPLISNKYSVTNNYELNDAFKIDIITGSNMAGKSTFLRTIGINTVLALSGAPVCGDDMTVSVITIVSYMRIKDSLNESTSTFKAELDRLQMLLAAVENEHKVFFLIDEMLRGTNSVDKYLGSKAVIEQLISKKGVGMVATHDLQIAELEKKYPDYIRNFYFDIQVVNGEMLFDYKMKHGECKTFNASLLLKQIGIDVDAVN